MNLGTQQRPCPAFLSSLIALMLDVKNPLGCVFVPYSSWIFLKNKGGISFSFKELQCETE